METLAPGQERADGQGVEKGLIRPSPELSDLSDPVRIIPLVACGRAPPALQIQDSVLLTIDE